ncbi:hypothetical protein SYJ56_03390 [Algoriphagus sp. D3-2-R+10]|uniref:hypothetical protein n=1 Tax=Algoriphagus aurantiacus TaxID=3103948 RepID=UPI002B3E9FF9|nr:hypothetical protein [Algoriphagus sp. D3-2-R+10]MEB2774332.1 hypothetical protein [Algoriphagus sp. D3-2-R+10]
MRTSLKEIKELEAYIQGDSQGDVLLMSAKLQLDPDLSEKMKQQEKAYLLIREYGREKLREEIREIRHHLFFIPRHNDFKQQILNLFKR